MPFVLVSTLEDIGTSLQVSVFMRIALKWTTVGTVKAPASSPSSTAGENRNNHYRNGRQDHVDGERHRHRHHQHNHDYDAYEDDGDHNNNNYDDNRHKRKRSCGCCSNTRKQNQKKHSCSRPDVAHAVLTALLLCVSGVGSSLEAHVGVPAAAPYGTQNGVINAIKL